jgi:protein-tyrosine phosphatase
MLVTLPDNTEVLAHGRLGLVPQERIRVPDYAVYLDERWAGDPKVTWPYRVIDWPDFGLPSDEEDLFDVVVDIHVRAKKGELVEIACYGGLGRTGTVLSCLALRAGVHPPDAVEWVRVHYDQRAVETKEQEEFIARFAMTM